MLRNLEDAWGWIKGINEKLDRIFSGALLENSSITNGRMRFIGGTLRLDSGARLELFGFLDGEGTFHWTGPWEFDSPSGGRIAGDVELAGDFDLTGIFNAGNVRIQDGKIYVGASNQIVIDGATGRITVGTGASQIVIDGATGEITVPGTNPIRLHQASGLARIDLGSTAQIWSGGDGVTILGVGGGFVNVYSDGVDIGGAGKITRISNQVRLTNVQPAPGGVVTVPLLIDPSTGVVYR